MSNTCRIGVGGPVGSGKTALIEAITPYFLKLGLQVLIITNDIVTTEDAKHVRKMLKGYLAEERIIGVETGACPHTAPVRMNREGFLSFLCPFSSYSLSITKAEL